ncbi:hypothetical protein GCM10009555_040130 [Acrocarpospora macrocephala]|uniref:HTH gntR-type domain-containing protein n=1 Tax=Acrocarpospora macrocephala TaxID=150177 RepID=A0A5M3WMB1_9ACTN|nr:GntR family transcriptional regulator [Acrocarpospora macrocephala]GES10014.1 hypothetical protein Amac_036110 [Acrocarpospora macrocephala]
MTTQQIPHSPAATTTSQQPPLPPLPHAAGSEISDNTAAPSLTTRAVGGSAGTRTKIIERRKAIVEKLAGQIASGKLAEGTPFPTLKTLMRNYRITLSTAARVQRELRDRKIIRRMPGYGFVVGVPDPPPQIAPRSVEEQTVEVATILVQRIRSGQIRPRKRVASVPQLMKEFGITQWVAWSVLHRLRSTGWAYQVQRKGTMANHVGNWPPRGTSLERKPVPEWLLQKENRITPPRPPRNPPPD